MKPPGRSASSVRPHPPGSYRTLHCEHTKYTQTDNLITHFSIVIDLSLTLYTQYPKNGNVGLLQMFPGDVRVAGGPGPRRGSAESKNMRSECGQSLGAKISVDEIQMRSHNHHCRVWRSGLFTKHQKYILK